ncbi:MAG TPA: pilin [Candidatus Saccharimonadales bacterium]|nr:pilin [Candidatus Saccharimonadales bacterium]
MIKTLKNMLLTIFSSGALLMPVLAPATVYAQTIDENLCAGASLDINSNACNPADPLAEDKVNSIIKLVINLFSVIVGIISVVMIIVGGVKYITSGGASEKVTGAKNTILFAVIGLIVVALAQIIVRFVLSKVSTS